MTVCASRSTFRRSRLAASSSSALTASPSTMARSRNLSKDSRIEAKTVSEMYPGYETFAEAIADADPDRRVDTPLRRRLAL